MEFAHTHQVHHQAIKVAHLAHLQAVKVAQLVLLHQTPKVVQQIPHHQAQKLQLLQPQ